MYRKMLVPLDTSEFAECVLAHVKEMATAHSIPEVVLLSVVEPARSVTVAYMGEDFAREAHEKDVQGSSEYLERTKNVLGLMSSKVTTEVQVGRAAEGILDYIDKYGVDVVVVSSHGRSGVSRWFLGSVAEKLIRNSPVPVFLVPSLACRLPA